MKISHLGCDPEVFLRHKLTGEFISSVGLIGGSKEYPMPIGAGCAVQEDNVAVEFNTPPCASAEDFIKHIHYNMDFIKARAETLGLELAIVSSAVFSNEQLATPAAQEFGCEPDYNAWKGGEQNPRPRANDPNLRSAGGHIHVETDLDCLEIVKAMDKYVGCPMIEFDDDTRRRELYGNPGAFRKKPYGVEYRTASNAWIKSDDLIRWVWAQTEKAIAFVAAGGTISDEDGELIQQCIKTGDKAILATLREKFGDI